MLYRDDGHGSGLETAQVLKSAMVGARAGGDAIANVTERLMAASERALRDIGGATSRLNGHADRLFGAAPEPANLFGAAPEPANKQNTESVGPAPDGRYGELIFALERLEMTLSVVSNQLDQAVDRNTILA